MERITPENIQELKPNEIFVFGSNEAGRHGKGAAKLAMDRFGAKYGQAFGIQGQSFAIPTKNFDIKTLPLRDIGIYVQLFLLYVKIDPKNTFLVTEIGCGLAGYKPSEIAPLFKDCIDLENVYLPKSFWEVLKERDMDTNTFERPHQHITDTELFGNLSTLKYTLNEKLDVMAFYERRNPQKLYALIKEHAPSYYISDGFDPPIAAFTMYKDLKKLHSFDNSE